MNAERLSGRAGATRPGEGRRDPVSLTVDISLTQIALIAAETAPLVRRFFPNSDSMQNLAKGVERLLSARADTLEARMYAEEVVRAWRRVADTLEQRELLLVHRKLRGIGRQDRVVERLRRLETALASTAPSAPRRRPSRRKTLAG
jgi:hypothetical protein